MVEVALYTAGKTIATVQGQKLAGLWNRCIDARKTGKSPTTIRMYGWVAQPLGPLSLKLPAESQSIFG